MSDNSDVVDEEYEDDPEPKAPSPWGVVLVWTCSLCFAFFAGYLWGSPGQVSVMAMIEQMPEGTTWITTSDTTAHVNINHWQQGNDRPHTLDARSSGGCAP